MEFKESKKSHLGASLGNSSDCILFQGIYIDSFILNLSYLLFKSMLIFISLKEKSLIQKNDTNRQNAVKMFQKFDPHGNIINLNI